jgi:hypothetical protein
MPDHAPERISSALLKLADIAQRQPDSSAGFHRAMREYLAHTDAKFTQAAGMFVQLGRWVRGQGDEVVRTNERLATLGEQMFRRIDVAEERSLATGERLERLERRIEQLLRALPRGRGHRQGTNRA